MQKTRHFSIQQTAPTTFVFQLHTVSFLILTDIYLATEGHGLLLRPHTDGQKDINLPLIKQLKITRTNIQQVG